MNLPKRNIAVFINSLLSGGAEKQAVLLTKALNEKYNVWLVVYYGNKAERKYVDVLKKNNVKAIFLDGSHLKRCLSFYKFLRSETIDIIFSYLLTTNLIGGIIGKIAGVKFTIGGIRNSKLSNKKTIIQRFLQNNINIKTVYNNYSGYHDLSLKGFKQSKAIVIPNCYDINCNPIDRCEHKPVKILSVGRFVSQKDYPTAIKSIIELKKNYSNVLYTIIGYGIQEDEIRKMIDEHDANDYIKIIVNPKNIMDYYKENDIYLQTSLFEGLSNTVLEAMSFSLPLVLTNVGDNDRLVNEGKNGYLCRVRDTKQISKKLEILISSYKKRIDFGEKSYQILKNNYSFKKVKNQYIDFIESLK